MRILLSVPGHLKTVPMNEYVFYTLQQMGYKIRLFNFGIRKFYPRILRKLSQEKFLNYLDKKLIKLVEKFKPDIFLTIFGFEHRKAILEKLRTKGIITICWWLNDPFQFERSLKQASYYDYYFTNSKGSVNEYKKYEIKQVFYLPPGCFPEIHKKFNISNKQIDICFAGDWHPIREKVIESLIDEFSVAICGPWKKKLNKNSPLLKHIIKNGFFSPQEMVKIFNISKIVLNIHTWFGKWEFGLNPRVFEANACGAFQICDWKQEIPMHYEVDKEIVIYKSVKELKEKIKYFINRPYEREDIAFKAYLKSLKEHTYKIRLEKMFHLCGLI